MKNEPIKASTTFVCECNKEVAFDGGQQFKNHLKEAHGISQVKGTQQGTLFLDAADHHSQTHELKIEDGKGGTITAYKYSIIPRVR